MASDICHRHIARHVFQRMLNPRSLS
jgi:hypothetical protein